LYYPANYEAGKKYRLSPRFMVVHQEQTRISGRELGVSDSALSRSAAAFVLRPNYHGSNDYGLKWVESICCGKYYDLETPDINAGVDYLIAKGMGDPDRVATMGWSNGSILSTSLLITYPDRYKVASVGAGDIEWFSDWANVDFGESFDAYYFGKSPFQIRSLHQEIAGLQMDRIKAPVFDFSRKRRPHVPFAQSWTYFRTLQWHGKVPVKFVIFPGEPHGPRKLTHQLRKLEEESRLVRQIFFQGRKAFQRSAERRLTAGSNVP